MNDGSAIVNVFETSFDSTKLCLFLLSHEASFITGENIWINSGRL